MSHVKSGGAVRQHSTRRGKRLGVKKFGGEQASIGQIIIRQQGSKVRAGDGVGTGRDFTLFALKDGVVEFFKRQSKQFVKIS